MTQSVGDDHDLGMVAKARQLLLLVPWRMRGPLVLLTSASVVTALLDTLGVLAMLPLMQLLTTPQALPEVVSTYVVPLVGTEDRKSLLLAIALFVGLMFILKNVLMVGLRWWSLGVIKRASAAAQTELLQRYVHASYASHRQRSKAQIIQTVNGSVPGAFSSVVLGFVSIAADAFTVLLLLATLVALTPIASVLAVVLFGGTALVMVRIVKPHALAFGWRSLELDTAMWGFLNPAIEGLRETRILGREQLFVDKYRNNRRELINPSRAQQILGELPRYVMETVLIFGVILIAIILFSVRPEAEAFGLLAVFAAAAMRLAPAANRIVGSVNTMRTGRAALDGVVAELGALDRDALLTPRQTEAVTIPEADIEVRDLGFRYPDASTNVLTGVSTTIPLGHTVALVGSSGAGKTTFADLLLGLFTPTEGVISVGGVNISDHADSWRTRIAAVSQRVYIWDATVRDLITFGEPVDQVDPDWLDHVIEQAQLSDIITSMPQGLDTHVGEGGTRISGGQAQRIGIARALYANPDVLVLDEATSALDNETEHQITATLEALHGQMTIIVVAHRLSTVRHADSILFFSSGRLVDSGTMTELRHRNGEFARLVELGQLS